MKTAIALGLTLAATTAAFADFSYSEDNLANRTPAQVSASRAAVEADLAVARKSGELFGLHGAQFNRISPYAYPRKPVVAGLTRAQVQAELSRAISEGDMLAANESGLTLRQLSPTLFAKGPRRGDDALMAGEVQGKHISRDTVAE